jgi:hypothetical protein
MKAYVQRIHIIDSWEDSDKLTDKGLLNLATYLYSEGFIKVNVEWDSEKKRNVTHYSIEAVIKEEYKPETNDSESSEENTQKRKGFFERLFG